MAYFILAVKIIKTVLGSTHKAELFFFLFSVLPSISTFVFDLNLGHFWLFGAQMDYFWVGTLIRNTTHILQQLLFSCFPSNLTIDFVLILGLFWIFGTQMGYFFGCDNFQNCFGVYQ